MMTLAPEAAHDPGGKVKMALPRGMRGEATFVGPGDCYRTMLWRVWGAPGAPFAFFVGMNPSTAAEDVDDPTIRREVAFCMRWGFTRYAKANISAYRATDPKMLRGAPIECAENLPAILRAAAGANRVVLAFGTLPKPMRALAAEIVGALRERDIPLWCLGTTADGSPRHPLYLRNDAALIPWEGWQS